jgi:hypothetical protein
MRVVACRPPCSSHMRRVYVFNASIGFTTLQKESPAPCCRSRAGDFGAMNPEARRSPCRRAGTGGPPLLSRRGRRRRRDARLPAPALRGPLSPLPCPVPAAHLYLGWRPRRRLPHQPWQQTAQHRAHGPGARSGGGWSGRCPARAHPVADATDSSRRCARARASSRVWCPGSSSKQRLWRCCQLVGQPSARPHHHPVNLLSHAT